MSSAIRASSGSTRKERSPRSRRIVTNSSIRLRHNGRIVKTMGDGILVEFPSPVEAVRSAIEIQERAAETARSSAADRRIAWRIGINLGDVVAEGDDLHGDA